MIELETRAWRIEPVGDQCLLISFGNTVDSLTNSRVLGAAAYFMAHPLPGVRDVVPSFTTLALHYLPQAFEPTLGTPYDQLCALVTHALALDTQDLVPDQRTVEVPVCYGGEYGPDLDEVARRCNLTAGEVIALHGESPSVVYTFYFAPGNPFAGGLDPRLRVPRRSTPRIKVPAGSVAIANNLSTIYQLEMPGGWNLIGRTPWNLFDFKQDPPSRLRLGDRLRFVPISAAEYASLKEPRS
jgi:inhibitor of KinA